MRPDRSHWLLLPLFALPAVVALVLIAWADADFMSLQGRAAAQAQTGTLLVRALHGPELNFWHSLANTRPIALYIPPADGEPGLLVHRPTVDLGQIGPEDRWVIGAQFPAGASPAELADPDRRVQLEIGGTDATDPRATAFARLHREPQLDVLREADLPAATKLYLLDRIPGDFADRETIRTVLALAASFDPKSNEVGIHPFPGGYALRLASIQGQPHTLVTYKLLGQNGPRWTLVPASAMPSVASRDIDGMWTLGFGTERLPGAFWSQNREWPIRGVWSLAPRHGSSWLDAPRYRKWIPVCVGGTLAYLVLPIALLLAMRRRRRLDAARVRFLTEIAHDLRTPLTSIRLHAELLASGRGKEEKGERYLEVLERESTRASDLLGNLLDLSRLERGARTYDLADVDLAESARSCAEEFRRLHPDRAADVSAEGASSRVRADATALARCLRNLLDNAGKYTAPGTAIRVRWGGGAVRVEDEGRGVRDAEKMFERYVRGANGTSVSGTGLGLSLVRELVQGMGGRVAYRDGKPGAVFEIELPEVKDA